MLRGGNIESNPVHSCRKEHKFLILTKRPQRLLEFSQRMLIKHLLIDYPNVYLGATICNQAEADKNIPILLQIPGKRWLSIEPLLGPIDLRLIKGHTVKTTRLENGKPCYRNLDTGGRLSWVVITAALYQDFHLESPSGWVMSLNRECI